MPKMRELFAYLSQCDLEETVAFVVWRREDVENIINALNVDPDKIEYTVSPKESDEILEIAHARQDLETGITEQSVLTAYFELKDKESI